MAIKFVKEKPLSIIKEEDTSKKEEFQADIFEVIAMIYEEVEEIRSENTDLRNRIEILEGGAK
ncbi:hypothetical protein [Tissierella sp.]|uniref:hypothetical protein n=1 Tax=Tissierella sp. TaxID=41274 RepID=UPI00305D9C51